MTTLSKSTIIRRLLILHQSAFSNLISGLKEVQGDLSYLQATQVIKSLTNDPEERRIYFAAINKTFNA
jgi:hypothetical protein